PRPRLVAEPDVTGPQPLVPLRPDLPDLPHPDDAVPHPGSQRRWLGALRGPGESPPPHRLSEHGLRVRLAPPHPAHDRDLVLLPPHRSVAVRNLRGARTQIGRAHV